MVSDIFAVFYFLSIYIKPAKLFPKKTMSGHQPLFFNIQINFCREQNIYTKRSIHTCLLSYLPEIDIEISTKPGFLNVVTFVVRPYIYSLNTWAWLLYWGYSVSFNVCFFVSPYTGQLSDLLHFHSDVIQSLVSGHVFLQIHNFKFTFHFTLLKYDPPIQCILVWCQIKDVIALIATLISVTQLFVLPDHFRLTVLLTGSRSDLKNKKIRRKERDFLYSQCEQFPDSSPESQSWRKYGQYLPSLPWKNIINHSKFPLFCRGRELDITFFRTKGNEWVKITFQTSNFQK